MFEVSTSLIRFWEKEFSKLKPKKNRRGDRQFTKEDIYVLEKIYNLVKIKGYTLEGAKKELKTAKISHNSNLEVIQRLKSIRDGLSDLKDTL